MTASPSTAPRRTRGNLLRALLAGVAVTALAPSFATLAIAEDARVKDMSLDVQTPYKAAIVKVSSSDGSRLTKSISSLAILRFHDSLRRLTTTTAIFF